MTPSFTVVICTRDRPLELERCLNAVRLLDYPEFEILVVDNAPTGDDARDLATRFDARYVVEPVVGLSRARNRGALESRTELIAYIDDDAIPEKNWLSVLANEFRDPLVMATTGRIVPTRVETEAERFCHRMGLTDYGERRRVIDRSIPQWFEMLMFGGIGMGANMAFRRSAFESWPGFDLRLGRGAPLYAGEEEHAFLALVDRGYRVVYAPEAIVAHPYPSSMEEVRSRWMRTRASQMAFLTLIAVEQPRHIFDIARYAISRLRREPRDWRTSSTAPKVGIPRLRELMASVSGFFLYARTRFP
ncbi:MAG: glycosyltransferase family 2 protein [Candidatus Binatus sp.]|uniref:glycosyltransferase n=1 Tax=Candidatus Binatus sp. TaxID=2811406 RepID=UPI00271763D6|nr:glycosyltransferase family 2 protein [Candidatus Binatus sp.]MDO8432764.1 glycosyltransferase family 2 protein [Candidatus Binatus sp.]